MRGDEPALAAELLPDLDVPYMRGDEPRWLPILACGLRAVPYMRGDEPPEKVAPAIRKFPAV